MGFLGLSTEAWSAIGSIAAAGGTIVAAVGLWFGWRSIRQNTRAMELQVLESIFRDVRALDQEYLAEFNSWQHERKNAWSASFFNTVEYLCFVVNHQVTKDATLRKFFFDALPAWEKLLIEHGKAGIIHNSEAMFPEFKKACKHPSKLRSRVKP